MTSSENNHQQKQHFPVTVFRTRTHARKRIYRSLSEPTYFSVTSERMALPFHHFPFSLQEILPTQTQKFIRVPSQQPMLLLERTRR